MTTQPLEKSTPISPENVKIIEEFNKIAKKLNLREETVSGVDEYGMMRNFLFSTLTAKDNQMEEIKLKIEKMANDLKIDGIEDRYYFTKSQLLSDVLALFPSNITK